MARQHALSASAEPLQFCSLVLFFRRCRPDRHAASKPSFPFRTTHPPHPSVKLSWTRCFFNPAPRGVPVPSDPGCCQRGVEMMATKRFFSDFCRWNAEKFYANNARIHPNHLKLLKVSLHRERQGHMFYVHIWSRVIYENKTYVSERVQHAVQCTDMRENWKAYVISFI